MNLTRESWAVYYADGGRWTNEDGRPEMAPKTNVLAIAHFTVDNRRQIETAKDFYYYDPTPIFKDEAAGTWYACDVAGLYQYLFKPGWKCVLFGVIVHDVIWRRELARITKDFPEALGPDVKLPQSIVYRLNVSFTPTLHI